MELGKQLLAAARDGDTEGVRGLMARGAPFTADWLGTSPLHLTAQYGNYSTCEVGTQYCSFYPSKISRYHLLMSSEGGQDEESILINPLFFLRVFYFPVVPVPLLPYGHINTLGSAVQYRTYTYRDRGI